MQNVEILSWHSQCNLITSGNNHVTFKARNRNSYSVIFKIALLDKKGNWSTDWREFEISGGEIRDFSLLGKAWQKSRDIRIVSVQ